MTLKDIVAKFKFDVDDKKLKDLDSRLEGIKRRMDLLIGVQIAKGLFHIAEQFSKIGEEIQLSAQAAGIAVEEWQKLAFAAKMNNVEQSEMSQGLRVLSKQLYEARNGGKGAVEAFQKLGLSQEQVNGFKNSKDALLALSDRFKDIQDPIKKAALAQELLGRGGGRMVGLLSKGSAAINQYGDEAERLGIILSGKQVAALDKLENSLQKLFVIFKSIGAFVAATFAPALIYLIEAFSKFIAANRELIQSNIISFLKQMAYGFGFVFGFVEALVIQVMKLAKAFGFEGNLGGLIAKLLLLAIGFYGVAKALSVVGFAWKVFAAIANGVGLMTAIKGMAVWLWALVAPLWAVVAPFVLWGAAIAAVVVLVRDLWALLNNKPTWIGQAGGWAAGKVSGLFGGGASDGAPPAGVTNNNTAGSASTHVEAPVTINVPEGTSPGDVGKSVKEGIAQHLDRVMRQTNRSTAPTVAY